MAFYKNKAGQGITVYAVDANGDPVLGDAANITAKIVRDGAAPVDTDDEHPDEIGLGLYRFVPTQAESNADEIILVPTSATEGVRIEPVQIFTEPERRSVTETVEDAIAMLKAAMANKRTLDIANHVDTIYEDDGVTPLVVLGLSESDGVVTRQQIVEE